MVLYIMMSSEMDITWIGVVFYIIIIMELEHKLP